METGIASGWRGPLLTQSPPFADFRAIIKKYRLSSAASLSRFERPGPAAFLLRPVSVSPFFCWMWDVVDDISKESSSSKSFK